MPPPKGKYDLRFQLFNQAANGSSQSAALEFDSVSVAGGVFTVQLDFSLSAFLGVGNLFLEIGVRPGAATGSTAYTTLAPRQPLTAAPYSIRAQSATNADLLNGLSADNFIRNGTQGQGANFNIYGSDTINGSLTITGAINGTATNAINATNSQQLGGTAANQFVQTNDTRLSDTRTPTAGSANYVQNTTTQQADSNFNVSGNGIIGGTLSANVVNANSTSENVLRGTSSSTVGTRLALQNTTTGGATWNVISTGSGNGEGAGRLIFFNEGSNTAPLQINGGANVIGNLTVSGAINGATKNFKIDHPLDPLNKTLTYTSIESPDMMNIYNGNITTNSDGEATIKMPDYFERDNIVFLFVNLNVVGRLK